MKTRESSKLRALWFYNRNTENNRRLIKQETTRARRRVDRSVIREQAASRYARMADSEWFTEAYQNGSLDGMGAE